jgi:hypothetical protein
LSDLRWQNPVAQKLSQRGWQAFDGVDQSPMGLRINGAVFDYRARRIMAEKILIFPIF